MFSSLKEVTLKYDINFSDEHNKYLNEILDIYNGKIDKYKKSEDGLILNVMGLYYQYIEMDYELMKKYYLMSIELGNTTAMNNLGNYYKNIDTDYELMMKYYLMAIELRHSVSMNTLGNYYHFIEEDYELMKKYYLMAIESDYEENDIILSDIEKYYYLKIYKNKKDVNIFKNKVSMNSKEQECGICDIDELCIPLECSHFVCRECYIKFYESKCPYCRMEF